jgi:hypothetical protein
MRLTAIAPVLLCAVVLLCDVVAQAQTTNSAHGRPIFTRQNHFAIPFHVTESTATAGPTEVRLYVRSATDGVWRLSQNSAPQRRFFNFQAPGDGRYEFAIRNVGRDGKEYPQGDLTVGLTVVVDTTQPRVELDAHGTVGGQINARWQMSDPNLDPLRTMLHYRVEPDGYWRRLAVDPANDGKAEWSAGVVTGVVTVRAETVDAAGNRAVTQKKVTLQPLATTQVRVQSSPNTAPVTFSQQPPRQELPRPRPPATQHEVRRPASGAIAWNANRSSTWAARQQPPPAQQSQYQPYRAPVHPPAYVSAASVRPTTVRLLSVEQGTGAAAREIVIRYHADAANLAAQPITLYYRVSPRSAPVLIAANQVNTGRHVWQIDQRVPQQLYLYLEVRDQRGNIARAQSERPVFIQRQSDSPTGNRGRFGDGATCPRRYQFF